MNWYKIITAKAIWDVRPDGSCNFEKKLRRYYELEYKFSKFRDLKFNSPSLERRDNILNGLRINLKNSIENLSKDLKDIMSGWLGLHDSDDGDNWARHKIQDAERFWMIQLGDDVFLEYIAKNFSFSDEDHFSVIWDNVGLLPSIDNLVSEIRSERNTGYSLEDLKEEIGGSLSELEEMAVERGLRESLIFEFFSNISFKNWVFNQCSGTPVVQQAREKIKSSYSALVGLDSNNVGASSAVISLAINAVHSSGKLLEDYAALVLKQDFNYEVLEELSNYDHSDWDQELRDIGLDI